MNLHKLFRAGGISADEPAHRTTIPTARGNQPPTVGLPHLHVSGTNTVGFCCMGNRSLLTAQQYPNNIGAVRDGHTWAEWCRTV